MSSGSSGQASGLELRIGLLHEKHAGALAKNAPFDRKDFQPGEGAARRERNPVDKQRQPALRTAKFIWLTAELFARLAAGSSAPREDLLRRSTGRPAGPLLRSAAGLQDEWKSQ